MKVAHWPSFARHDGHAEDHRRESVCGDAGLDHRGIHIWKYARRNKTATDDETQRRLLRLLSEICYIPSEASSDRALLLLPNRRKKR